MVGKRAIKKAGVAYIYMYTYMLVSFQGYAAEIAEVASMNRKLKQYIEHLQIECNKSYRLLLEKWTEQTAIGNTDFISPDNVYLRLLWFRSPRCP